MKRKFIYIFLSLLVCFGLIYYFNQNNYVLTFQELSTSNKTPILNNPKELKAILEKSKSRNPLQITDDFFGGNLIDEETAYGKKSYVLFSDKLHVIELDKENKELLDKWYPLKEQEFDKAIEIIEDNVGKSLR